MQESNSEVLQLVRTLRIIVFALIAGVSVFLMFVLFTRQPAGEWNILTTMGLVLASMGVIASIVVPRIAASGMARSIGQGTWSNAQGFTPSTDEGKLAMGYQTTTIIAAALLEGPAFLNTFAYLQDGHVISLGVVALMIVGMLTLVPTESRVVNWIDEKMRIIKDEQSMQR